MTNVATITAYGTCIACGAYHDHLTGCPFGAPSESDPYAELDALELAA